MGNINVNGMIISSAPIGEYDRRVEILTSEYGRISAFASGARKPNSELVSASRMFALGTFELYQGRSSYNIKHAHIVDYFTELETDVESAYYGFYFLEFCRYFSRENVEAGSMLDLLYRSLKALAKSNIDNRLVRAIFELKMLDINGICPAPEDIIPSFGRFSIGNDLKDGTAYAVRFVITSPIEKLYTFKLDEEVLGQFISVVNHLTDIFIDKKFKSSELLNTL